MKEFKKSRLFLFFYTTVILSFMVFPVTALASTTDYFVRDNAIVMQKQSVDKIENEILIKSKDVKIKKFGDRFDVILDNTDPKYNEVQEDLVNKKFGLLFIPRTNVESSKKVYIDANTGNLEYNDGVINVISYPVFSPCTKYEILLLIKCDYRLAQNGIFLEGNSTDPAFFTFVNASFLASSGEIIVKNDGVTGYKNNSFRPFSMVLGPDNNELFVTNYMDPSKIYVYGVDGKYKRTLGGYLSQQHIGSNNYRFYSLGKDEQGHLLAFKDDKTIDVLDPQTGSKIGQEITLDTAIGSSVMDGISKTFGAASFNVFKGRLYIANKMYGNKIYVFDYPENGTVAKKEKEITLPIEMQNVKITSIQAYSSNDKNELLVTDFGTKTVYFLELSEDGLSVLGIDKVKIEDNYPMYTVLIDPDKQTLYRSTDNEDGSTTGPNGFVLQHQLFKPCSNIDEVKPGPGEEFVYENGIRPLAMVVAGNELFVANYMDPSKIYVYDMNTKAKVRTLTNYRSAQTIPGSVPRFYSLGYDGTNLLVFKDSTTIDLLNPIDGTKIGSKKLKSQIQGGGLIGNVSFNVHKNYMYLANYIYGNEIKVFNYTSADTIQYSDTVNYQTLQLPSDLQVKLADAKITSIQAYSEEGVNKLLVTDYKNKKAYFLKLSVDGLRATEYSEIVFNDEFDAYAVLIDRNNEYLYRSTDLSPGNTGTGHVLRYRLNKEFGN